MKKLYIISLFTLTLGWFPFMWVAIWGSWNREYAMWVLFLGLFLCIVPSLIIGSLLSKKALWLNQEKLDKEIEEFREAKEKYTKATMQIVRMQSPQDNVCNKYTDEDIEKAWLNGFFSDDAKLRSEFMKSINKKD